MWAATGRCMAIRMQPVSLKLIWKFVLKIRVKGMCLDTEMYLDTDTGA